MTNTFNPGTGDKFALEWGNIIEVLGPSTCFGHVEVEGSLVPVSAYPCKLISGSAFGKETFSYQVYSFDTLVSLQKVEDFPSNYYRCRLGPRYGDVQLFTEAPDPNEWELVNVTSFKKNNPGVVEEREV